MDKWDTRDGGELRVSTGRTPTLYGYAIVFNTPTLIGEGDFAFTEIIAPSAVARTMSDPAVDLRALYNHNTARILGRQRATPPTLRVAVDAHGLAVEIDPPEGEAGVVESVRRGDISGMSFGFRPVGVGYTVDRSTNPPTMTLREAIIRELSVVPFPAYPATELAVRALGMARETRSVSSLLRARPAWLGR